MIHPSAVIYDNVEIGNNVTIHAGAVIGVPGAIRTANEWKGRVVIEDNVIIGANVVIAIGEQGTTLIGKGSSIMNQALIGHNVEIGQDVEVGAGVQVCGHAKICDRVKIKTGATIRNRLIICEDTVIGMGAVVVKSIAYAATYTGNPARVIENGWIKRKSGKQ